MKLENKSKEQLIQELIRIKKKNAELGEINREINQAKKQLTESERKYRDLVEDTLIGIANIDITGKILYVNKKLEKISGYLREEVVGQNVFTLGLFSDEMLAILKERLKERLISGTVRRRREVYLKRRDGKWIWIVITVKLIKKLGIPISFRIIVEEISEQMQAEEIKKLHLDEMDFLVKTALEFIQLNPKDDIYQFIGKKLVGIIKNSIVLVNSYDKTTDSFNLRALEGIGEKMKFVLKTLRKSPFGMSYPISDEKARKAVISGKFTKIPGGVHELSFGKIPKNISYVLEKSFNIGEINYIGFSRKKEIFGNAVIIMRKGEELQDL